MLKDVWWEREKACSWDLNGFWSGRVSFNVAYIFTIDVLGALRVIDGKVGIANVTGGEEVIKEGRGSGANVVAKISGFIRAGNLAAGKGSFIWATVWRNVRPEGEERGE